jgi:hypothetical protein
MYIIKGMYKMSTNIVALHSTAPGYKLYCLQSKLCINLIKLIGTKLVKTDISLRKSLMSLSHIFLGWSLLRLRGVMPVITYLPSLLCKSGSCSVMLILLYVLRGFTFCKKDCKSLSNYFVLF